MTDTTVRGYRPQGDRPKERQLSTNYLMLKPEGSKALTVLRTAIAKNGANCLGRPEEFSGETLMTDREAQIGCAGCPVFKECDAYARASHPAWGTHAGKVYGRKLDQEMKEEDANG